jgi:hypothetical protein
MARTSSPERSHNASDWTARQKTADIFGACMKLLTGVENSSILIIEKVIGNTWRLLVFPV